jgi:hypothetical protein
MFGFYNQAVKQQANFLHYLQSNSLRNQNRKVVIDQLALIY